MKSVRVRTSRSRGCDGQAPLSSPHPAHADRGDLACSIALYRAANLPSDSETVPKYERLGNVHYHAVWSTLAGSLLVAGAWGLL